MDTIFFPNRSRVGGAKFSANLIPLDEPIMKAWEYRVVAYLIKIGIEILQQYAYCSHVKASYKSMCTLTSKTSYVVHLLYKRR